MVVPRRRLLTVGGIAALGFAALGGRLFQMQVLDGSDYLTRAERNRLDTTTIAAHRGLLSDRHQIPLVRNRPAYVVGIVPADLPRRGEIVFRRLAKLIGGTPRDFAAMVGRATDPNQSITVRATFDPGVAQAINERIAELPGVRVDLINAREYVDGPVTSHLVGHVGTISEDQFRAAKGESGPYKPTDRVGQSGLESALEPILRGRTGLRKVERDASGRETATLGIEPARPGKNVGLTIDLALQREVHRLVSERIAQFELASVVVVDPSNGDVLAMSHLPAYDNGALADGIAADDFARLVKDPTHPLLNGAIGSAWPPGSCFKIITALAALDAGVVKPDTTIHCSGGIRLPGGAWLGCWAAHGRQDMVSALANSCDSYFYQLVGGEPNGKWDGVGPDRLAEWARTFGLGRPTGVEIPGEVAGIVPTPAWKRTTHNQPWYRGDTYISAIGQGFYTSTPIQMAMVAATVANGGTIYRPRLIRSTEDVEQKTIEQRPPVTLGRLASTPAHIEVVREGVRAGMLIGTSPFGARYYGTSWDSNIRDLPFAGKTGTSEYGVAGPDGKLPTHGWFVFWAPHDKPRIAGSVFVKRGRGAQEAGKLGSQIVKAYFGIV